MLPDPLKKRSYGLIRPLASVLHRAGVSPDWITGVGLALSVVCAYAYTEEAFGWALGLLLVAGLCDMLDGEVARNRNQFSKAGAYLDSNLDRYSEIVLFLGLLFMFLQQRPIRIDAVIMVYLAATGSLLVSYSRARAEGLGLEGSKALFERPERMIILMVGTGLACFGGASRLIPIVYLMAVGSQLSAGLRTFRHWQRLS